MPGKVDAYVTARGGVVVLNGPFPVGQAKKVAAICNAAPDMLIALKLACQHVSASDRAFLNGDSGNAVNTRDLMIAAIAKAEGRS